MNGLLHHDIFARLPGFSGFPGLAGAFSRLRGRQQQAMPLYRSEGFGEDLEAFDASYRPGAIIRRPPASARDAKERKQ